MKSKKGVYFLLVLVLAIWGAVVYKLFFQNKGGDVPSISKASFVAETVDLSMLNDTFSIHQNYRDPFLGKTTEKRISSSGQKAVSNLVAKPAPTLIKWPAIAFHGLIRNQKSNKQVALVQIDGHTYNMSPGETQARVELKRCFKDSVLVGFDGEKKTVKK
jgi:hypothetical protein